jgi:PIN domain
MASRRQKLQLKVVFDTSAIWTIGESYLLRREISDLVDGNRGDAHLVLEWILPEMVMRERIYQMQKEAASLLPAVTRLERVIGHPFNITEEVLQRRITEAVERQITEHLLLIHPASYDRIDWLRLIGDSVSRRPPFDVKSEKGFRDAIIAETFLQIVEVSPEQPQRCRIVLLSNDGLLSEAVRNRLGNRNNVQVLGSVDELKGLINTLISTVPEDYVTRLQTKAKEYFAKDAKKEIGLVFDMKVQDAVRTQCKEQLEAKPEGTDRRSVGNWELTAPRFVKKEGQRVFWASRFTILSKAFKDLPPKAPSYDVLSTNLFSPEEAPWPAVTHIHGTLNPANVITSTSVPQRTGVLLPKQSQSVLVGARLFDERFVATGKTVVDVNWSVLVNIKGVFSKPKIESIQFIETTWETVP